MKMENQAWKGFHGGEWQRSIDVRSFIQKNWTPYEGDGSFLTGPTRRTRAVWERCEDLLRQELRKGVLDVETHIVSGIDSFAPGYIDRENEVIVGLQTDAPLKRIVNLYGGIRMANSPPWSNTAISLDPGDRSTISPNTAKPTTRACLMPIPKRTRVGPPRRPAHRPAGRLRPRPHHRRLPPGGPLRDRLRWLRKSKRIWTPWTAPWTEEPHPPAGGGLRCRSALWRR